VYDRLTPLWRDWLYRDASRALDDALRASCPPNGHVLDLGCGTGAVLERLRAIGAPLASYTGVDQSPAMLARARAKLGALPGVRFERLDLEHDPLPAGPFDLVTSAWALEHLADAGRVVASAVERLRPGGRLVLFFEADGDSLRERALRRVWRFFGARLVPEREYLAWRGTISLRRFPAVGPSVVLAILSRPPDVPG
jgi:SAM-dependent methyltransferase